MPDDFLSLAQLTGYLAFIFGVLSFLQKDDRRLKGAVALQSFAYALHFALLGNVAGAAAALVTFVRAVISLYTRSRRIAAAILSTNLALGLVIAESLASWLPILASAAGTIAFFWFEGIAMRLVLLCATLLWLVNNLLWGSIGGTLLELFVGAVNGSTCYRLWRDARAARHLKQKMQEIER